MRGSRAKKLRRFTLISEHPELKEGNRYDVIVRDKNKFPQIVCRGPRRAYREIKKHYKRIRKGRGF